MRNRCPSCGHENDNGAVFCAQCGHELKAAPAGSASGEGRTGKEVKEAQDALVYSLIGIFCFGIFLGPFAITKGMKALNIIKDDPVRTGKGKAIAGMVIGIAGIVGWLAVLMFHLSR
ncbi:MAG: DUF4190 domain-containing protein [Candidatus Aminicenantes bacterium]|nr:DUF4190 domain-containing protein [Candidatus Aminicenantes bacterium]